MKTNAVAILLLGVFIGSVVTYFVVSKKASKLSQNIHASPSPHYNPVEEELDISGEEEGDSTLGGMDMTDRSDRDLCLTLSYSDMHDLVRNFEARSGYAFEGEVWKGRMPSEILGEIGEVLDQFEADSRALSSE